MYPPVLVSVAQCIPPLPAARVRAWKCGGHPQSPAAACQVLGKTSPSSPCGGAYHFGITATLGIDSRFLRRPPFPSIQSMTDRADEQAPECRADADDGDPGCRDQERHDGRDAVRRLLQSGRDRGDQRAEHGEPGDGGDEDGRRRGRRARSRRPRRARAPGRANPALHGRDPPPATCPGAASGLAMIAAVIAARLIACAAENGADRGGDARCHQRGSGRHGVAEGRHHHEARHVLPGHRHDEQRQPEARRSRAGRRRGATNVELRGDGPHCAATRSRRDTAITMVAASIAAGTAQRGASRKSTSQTTTIGSASSGYSNDRRDRCEADGEQDAGEHGACDRLRNARDRPAERRPQSAQQDEHAADQERADGRGEVRVVVARGDEQRGTRRRPGERNAGSGSHQASAIEHSPTVTQSTSRPDDA